MQDKKVFFTHQMSYDAVPLRASLDALLERMGGAERLIGRGSKVILKPNLVAAAARERNVLTDPAIVEAVIEICQDLGCKVRVCDARVIGSASGVAASNGILDVCKRHGVPFVEFDRIVSREVEGRIWGVAEELGWADRVINLPKLKGHTQLYFTGGIKNLFGCVSGKRKFARHMILGDKGHNFGAMLLDVARLVAPCVTLMDGIGAHAGRGPVRGDPVQVGLLAGAVNPLAMDRALLDWLRADLDRVSYIRAARHSDYWRPYLEPELEWVGEPFTTNAFYFPTEMSPIRFSAFHTARSVYRRLIKMVTEKAAL